MLGISQNKHQRQVTVDLFYDSWDKYGNPLEGIVSFPAATDVPVTEFSHLHMCLFLDKICLLEKWQKKKKLKFHKIFGLFPSNKEVQANNNSTQNVVSSCVTYLQHMAPSHLK